MLEEIIRRIRQSIYQKNNPSVVFHNKANVDARNCFFEGSNYVGDRTVLRNCFMGYGSYVADQSTLFSVGIGRFCSISSDVKIVCGKHPTETFVSTHPAFFSVKNTMGISFVSENKFKQIDYVNLDKDELVNIGNDVWIGFGARIFDGVTIADGTIVAAGAVVTKSTEPYSIVGGIPAKLIRKRFDDETISFLMDFKWWNMNEKWINDHSDEFSDIKTFVKNNKNIVL